MYKNQIQITSETFGMSKSSPNTKTPGASNACFINSMHAAPLAVFANKTNCSNGFVANDAFSITIVICKIKFNTFIEYFFNHLLADNTNNNIQSI